MMQQRKNKLQRAWNLLIAGSLEWFRSDAVSGRLRRLVDRLRRDPMVVGPETYLKTNLPVWKARYRESHQFKDQVWYTGIFLIFLGIVLWLSIGGAPDVPNFRINQNEIRFKAGSPQLAFIGSESIALSPLPTGAPVPARVAMDDTRTAPVSPSLNGRVVQLHAQLGDRVEAGDALVTIDSPDYGTALTDWQKADADAKRKRAAFARAKELLTGEAIARRDYEVAESDFRIADAEARRAYLRIANLVPYGKPDPESERLTLRAPVAGVVATANVNPGREIRADQPDPLFVVTDLNHLWVLVDAPEQAASGIRVGDVLLVSFDSLPGQVFKANVTRVSPVLDAQMRRVQIRAELDNSDLRLRPEMYGRAQVADPNAVNGLRVPLSSLSTDGIYTTVFIEAEPGLFRRQRVKVAFQDSQWAWLLPDESIRADDRVVTTGALLLASEFSQSAR
jgi:cobalt-zinc-cadmium efflux system membrane fusion protein